MTRSAMNRTRPILKNFMMQDPIGPVTRLEGIGPVRAQRLARLGVACIRDLLFLLPRRLREWAEPVSVAEASDRVGSTVTVRVRVRGVRLTRFGGRRSLVRVKVADESGEIDALFFNQPWMREHVRVGDDVELHGRVVDAKGAALASPKLGTSAKPLPSPGTVVPEYPLTDGVSQDFLAALCRSAVARYGDGVVELLPHDILTRLGLPPLPEAVASAHAPANAAEFDAARRRLAFESLLGVQARLQLARTGRSGRATAARIADARHAALLDRYPFALTVAQRRIAGELRSDLARTSPMRRLVQGDVGSGKTAVALYAAMVVAESGGQSAFMAPTELLAEQHFFGLRPLLERAGLACDLLTGSLARRDRRQVLERLEHGGLHVLFGTHALFSADVRYKRLDLAIIDEQHRFGVGQRAALADKGDDVHTLLMTATPIPRTLALSLYGDLDVSLLDEMPPGRGEVTTRWVRGAERRRVPALVRERLAAGEQAYWVCPRIGAEEDAEEESLARIAGAEQRFARIQESEVFAQLGVELVHGRLPAEERARRLDRFRRGEAKLLVATTVIEVGVDVPAATVMVIENAERLGLAQLHQLRGRIGRGPAPSQCLILGDAVAEHRFRLLEECRDGFLLAEEDLRQRGMGDLAGVRQSGDNLEGLDDPERDLDLLIAARDLARERPDVCALYGAGERATP
ncbi:MAG: ATP-dependent DNA helicase RecG [Planctomycetota bacterium]|nr:MAG: ATP-dependent DNA helicase RecG [Planctomycetota bacterium]